MMTWTGKLSDSLPCNLFVWYFCVRYVCCVGEGRVLCDVSREDKLLDCLIILFCVHYMYNFDYKVQRSTMMFLEKATFGMNLHDGQIPLGVSQIFTLLGQ